MNQSIIFTDQLYVEDDRVKFIAQQQGVNICCYVSFAFISNLLVDKSVNNDNAVQIFEMCRFDIEEAAEALINKEDFDDNGDISLN